MEYCIQIRLNGYLVGMVLDSFIRLHVAHFRIDLKATGNW